MKNMKRDLNFEALIKQLEEAAGQIPETKDPVQELQDELKTQIDSVSKILEIAKTQQVTNTEDQSNSQDDGL